MKQLLLLGVIIFSTVFGTNAQNVFRRDTIKSDYCEYRTGNFPLIITVPHGGKLVDSTLVLRTKENCPDPKFTTSYDSNTPELAELVDSIVFARTGKYPHIVFMNLKRTYIDVNRELINAVPKDCDELVNVYNRFYSNINSAKESIDNNFGAGLLLDFHAHGHKKQEIEIGYQIVKDSLNLSDEKLNVSGLESSCGIYNLIKTNKADQSFSDYIRGDNAFGTLLYKNGTPCIPHKDNPQPLDTKYFSGAYVTKSSGSCSGGTIDAIQLEFNRESRQMPDNRLKTAENLISTVQQFFNIHYNFKK